MSLTFSEVHAAEADRLVREHGYDRLHPAVTPRDLHDKIMAAQFRPVRPSFFGQGTEAEVYGRGTAAQLSTSEIEDRLRDFRIGVAAANPLLGLDDVEAMELAAAGGERDPESRAGALLWLAELTPGELNQFAVQLARSGGDVSAEERRRLAKRGWALPSGKYPISHAGRGPGSLHSAAVLAASGHGTPEELAQARALIKKAAAHFGVDLHTLPGFSQDDQDLVERAARDRKRKGPHHHGHPTNDDDYGEDTGGPSGQGESGSLAATVTVGGVRYLKAKNNTGGDVLVQLSGGAEPWDDGPIGYYLELAAEEAGPARYVDGTYRSPAAPPFRVHDAGTSSDVTSVPNVGAEVARYLGMCTEKPVSGNRSYPPGSPAARRAGEERALAGGRPQSWDR